MVFDKEKAKTEIGKIISDFRENYTFHKEHSESNTETRLVEPLFKALGWNEKDWIKQEQIHRGKKQGRADYVFKINDRVVFVLEVKKVGVQLEKEANRQVISYALSRRIPFAISTNFECMNIFCVEQEDALNNKFRVFSSPEDYVNNITDFLYLSKESFMQNSILKKAESEGRLKKRVSIDKTLLEDFMNVRKLIANDVEKTYPDKYAPTEKDEIVQRIIDRLIFIRRCEDTGINPNNITLEEINHLPDNKAYTKLKEIFTDYNKVYNSGLFAPNQDNDCDTIKIDGTIIKKLLGHLYESKDKKYIYDFDWIDADVLGQVYEQYLGIILSQTKSGKAQLKDGQAHRKEQGIYYTPTYIVDYIVKTTVGEWIKTKKPSEIERIKILDAACGSGSFLIKTFDYLYTNIAHTEKAKQHRLDFQGAYSIKTELLKNNIYGVDLDNRAVEITKLNLLLKAAEKDRKLPEEIDLHIRHGNSLIDEELIDKNAFKWTGDFKEETFDIVIGNPPYVRQEEIKQYKSFFETKFPEVFSGTADLYVYFFERGLRALKEGGYFGFIVSNKFIHSQYGYNLRKYLKNQFKILHIVDKFDDKVFADATVDPCIIILKKEKSSKNHQIIFNNKIKIYQNTLSDESWVLAEESNLDIKNKLEKRGVKIKDWEGVQLYFGIKSGLNDVFIIEEDIRSELIRKTRNAEEIIKPILRGRDIGKYSITWKKLYLIVSKIGIDMTKYPSIYDYLEKNKPKLLKRTDYKPKIMAWYNLRPCDYYPKFETSKIIYPDISSDISFYWDEQGYFINDSCHMIIGASKYWVAILNSTLIKWYIQQIAYSLGESGTRLKQIFMREVPIVKNANQLDNYVDRMMSLSQKIIFFEDKKTADRLKIEQEKEKLYSEIDDLVYKLYGITEAERKIIEDSLK